MTILKMSISAAALILAVAAIRSLAINKLPKKTFFILWGVVLCRLLIPFSVSSPLRIYTLMNRGGQLVVTVPDPSNVRTNIIGGTVTGIQAGTMPEAVPTIPWTAIIGAVGFAICTLSAKKNGFDG